MMFCAGHTVSKKDVIDNVVTIPVNGEVETVDGWKNCTDIVIGDKLKDEFETCEVIQIVAVDNNLLLTLKEVMPSC